MKTSILKAGTLSAEPGKKTRGWLDVPGTDVKIPLTLVNGRAEGKTVVILGGIHGGEYVGIETAVRLAAALQPEELSGAVIIAHPVNTGAFFARQQYIVPGDGKNLNRMFPGKADGTLSEQMAHTVSSQLFAQADFMIDLHGGDIHEALTPFVIFANGGEPEINRVSEEAARCMGLPYLIGGTIAGGTYGAASQMGVPSFLAELGMCGRWSEGEVEAFSDGVRNVLRYLGVLVGAVQPPPEPAVLLDAFLGANAGEDGCWYPFVKIGDRVRAGQKIGETRDLFANLLGEYHAPADGVVIVLISSLAITAGAPIFAIGRMGA